jgi:hypothetical protein
VGLRKSERLLAGHIAQIGGRKQYCSRALAQREGEACLR